MLDSQIVKVLIDQIRAQLTGYGIDASRLRVTRSNQPTAQNVGRNYDYQVFITPVTNTRIGWGRQYGADNVSLTHTKQRSYQISTLSEFDPATMAVMPAHELAEILGDLLQHPDATNAMRAEGVKVFSCSDVRPAFELNESEDWQSMPSFDIVVSFDSVYTKATQQVTEADGVQTGI